MRHATFLLAALLFSLPVTARAVDVTEPPDLSGDVGSPSAVTLTNGRNTVSGTLATPGDRQDNFTVTVPPGHRLRAVRLTIEGGGFIGAVTFNLSESRTNSGPFTMGLPMPAGTYYVQVVTDFSTGTSWAMSFFVAPEDAGPICGDGSLDAGEGCDDGNVTECDGCSNACTEVVSGCQIEGACVAEAAAHPTIDCIGCVPERSRTAWSPLPRDRRCDDDTFCTERDACDGAGNCAGITRTCDDGDACTTDACDEATATCTAAPIPLCGVDAGMDAGAITGDAGTTTDHDAGRAGDAGRIDDAGGTHDAGASSDAGRGDTGAVVLDAASAVDAGAAAPSSGCGCRATDRRGSASWISLLAIALGLALRKRARA